MPITTCTSCEKAFEAWSEEYANEPGRLCRECDTREWLRAKDAAHHLHGMVKDLEKDNTLLRQRLTLTEAVVNAARKCVNNPAWAGICDEDIELEVSLRALEEGK